MKFSLRILPIITHLIILINAPALAQHANVHQVVAEMFGDTVILWNRITLEADVRGNVVSNEFTVTEVYQDQNGDWSLLDLTFSSVRDTHNIEE